MINNDISNDDNPLPLWKQFEIVVSKILRAHNFSVTEFESPGGHVFDLLATIDDGQWAIEVKFYRTVRAQPNLIENAASRLINNSKNYSDLICILIVSSIVSQDLRDIVDNKYGVLLLDRGDLKKLASINSELATKLDAILESDPDEVITSDFNTKQFLDKKPKKIENLPHEKLVGTDICIELRNTPAGKEDFRAYEKLCERILKYLFPNDLVGWHSQNKTSDDLNRFDFVCRVKPSTEFWKFIIEHLNSRYVLFEFKNYSNEISQGQVLTTEKYLLEKGLRKVGIIFTRKGGDDNAITMTQGAMREHGKLMLIIDDEDVCEMLHMKERGEDPSDYLFELADNFLLKLPR